PEAIGSDGALIVGIVLRTLGRLRRRITLLELVAAVILRMDRQGRDKAKRCKKCQTEFHLILSPVGPRCGIPPGTGHRAYKFCRTTVRVGNRDAGSPASSWRSGSEPSCLPVRLALADQTTQCRTRRHRP